MVAMGAGANVYPFWGALLVGMLAGLKLNFYKRVVDYVEATSLMLRVCISRSPLFDAEIKLGRSVGCSCGPWCWRLDILKFITFEKVKCSYEIKVSSVSLWLRFWPWKYQYQNHLLRRIPTELFGMWTTLNRGGFSV